MEREPQFVARSPVEELALRAKEILPRGLVTWLFGSMLLYVVIREIFFAAANPLFFDEILTLAVSSQSTVSGIWTALSHSVDGQPPMFYLIERALTGILGNTQVALRLVSVLSMASTMVCIFLYIRRRHHEWIAFLCTMLLMVTSLFRNYAADARPYSILMTCIAFALICYDRLASFRWAILFGLSLALAQGVYYLAIFAVLPFALSEVVVSIETKQIRWQAWIAFVFCGLPLIICWPLLSHMRTYYGSRYWVSTASVASLPKFYGSYLLLDAPYAGALIAVLSAGVIGSHFLRRQEQSKSKADGALILTFLALPIIALIVTTIMRAGMLDRYVLATIFGVCLATACLLARATLSTVLLFALFLGSSAGLHEISFWRGMHGIHPQSDTTSVEQFIETAGHSELPVVVSDGLSYLSLNYYASPEWSKRFVFVGDADLATKYLANDSVDKNVMALRPYLPIHASEFSEFMATHSEFLLYSEDPGYGFGWLPYHLSRGPWSLRVYLRAPHRTLYLVTRTGGTLR
jgi:Dolichyl-phosphate-mannose-protein mannosyltransferase